MLFVEDSELYSAVIKETLSFFPNLEVDHAATTEDAEQLLLQNTVKYDIALIDLHLPGAPPGEFAKAVCEKAIPTIVFSGSDDLQLRQSLFKIGIIDFVSKGSPAALLYLKELIEFLIEQKGKKVLLVNGEKTSTREQLQLLSALRLNANVCATEKEAINLLSAHKDTVLAIISHCSSGNMLRLVDKLRSSYKPSQLSIIAIPENDSAQATDYLRSGATDALRPPFSIEEFNCRVRNAIKMQTALQSLEEAASTDPLTGLLNRRAFSDVCKPVLASSVRSKRPMALAFMDIDHFKNINDTFGHDTGDIVLKAVAQTLDKHVRETDIIARYGGEEFCLMMPDVAKESLPTFFKRLQQAISSATISQEYPEIEPTLSYGVKVCVPESLDQIIQDADALLYKAKEEGRDRFIIA